jgi:hypothetical protein
MELPSVSLHEIAGSKGIARFGFFDLHDHYTIIYTSRSTDLVAHLVAQLRVERQQWVIIASTLDSKTHRG